MPIHPDAVEAEARRQYEDAASRNDLWEVPPRWDDAPAFMRTLYLWKVRDEARGELWCVRCGRRHLPGEHLFSP